MRSVNQDRPGEPYHIMYANIVSVLERSKLLHKYPFGREETIRPLLPVTEDTPQWGNLRLAAKWANYTTFEVNERHSPFPGSGNILFWIEDEWMDITTQSEDVGFFIFDYHPLHDDIYRWAFEASVLDEWMGRAKMYLNRTLKAMKHPRWVNKYWPAIVTYAGTMPDALMTGMREPRPTSIHLDTQLQEEIENKLTLASLLDRNVTCQAWVGRYPGIRRV